MGSKAETKQIEELQADGIIVEINNLLLDKTSRELENIVENIELDINGLWKDLIEMEKSLATLIRSHGLKRTTRKMPLRPQSNCSDCGCRSKERTGTWARITQQSTTTAARAAEALLNSC